MSEARDKDVTNLIGSIEQEEVSEILRETFAEKASPGRPRINKQNGRPMWPDYTRAWKKDYSKARFHNIGTPFWQEMVAKGETKPNDPASESFHKLLPGTFGAAGDGHANFLPKEAYGKYAEQKEKKAAKKPHPWSKLKKGAK